MNPLSSILQERIKAFNSDPQKAIKIKSVEYSKKWNEGVRCFQEEINKDRKKVNLPPVSFIAIRQKLVALKEVDDLRWFFYHCRKYGKTKDKTGQWNSFSKCFWGALRVVEK